MMSYKEAMRVFIEHFPRLNITKCIDYDKDHFVIEAVEEIDVINYNNPYYGIDKHSGKITSFIPGFDLDAFFDAVENRTVYSSH